MSSNSVSNIAREMGVAEDLNWGKSRLELETGLTRTAYKLLGVTIGIWVALFAIMFLMPDGIERLVAGLVLGVIIVITTEYSIRFKRHTSAERSASDEKLMGRMPFCVAVLTIRTVPDRMIAFLRFGQTGNTHEYRIATAEKLTRSLGTYVSHNPYRYVMVGTFQREQLGTVQDFENLLRSKLIMEFARKVGGNLLLPPFPLLEELREIERKNAVPGSMR